MSNFIKLLLQPGKRADEINEEKNEFLNGVQNNENWHSVAITGKSILSSFETMILKAVYTTIKYLGGNTQSFENIARQNKQLKKILYYKRKTDKLQLHSSSKSLPYIFDNEKLDFFSTKLNVKLLKTKSSLEKIKSINITKSPEIVNSYLKLPKKLQNVVKSIAAAQTANVERNKKNTDFSLKKIFFSIYTFVTKWMQYDKTQSPDKETEEQYINNMLESLRSVYNEKQENIFDQIKKLLEKKEAAYRDSLILTSILNNAKTALTICDLPKVDELSKKNRQKINEIQDDNLLCTAEALLEENVKEIDRLKKTFEDIIDQTDHHLSVYEISAERLTTQISKEILDKEISVTMVAAECTGLAKQGGLAEAIQGMAKGLKESNPGNKVRLIFPKYNLVPADIQQLCNETTPIFYEDRFNGLHKAYKIEVSSPNHPLHGIELYLIEDSSFEIKSNGNEKPSIYDEDQKRRFPIFSGLAADLIKHLSPTDIIHLHDWHVAGVALRLKTDNLDEWTEGKVPPIVFTYHNNNREAQGRIGSGAYNYSPVIQGLIESGIANKDVNILVETLKISDAVTTVSEAFAIESQMQDKGEGIAFAVKEAAAKGKLTGIINGSNPNVWDPSTNKVLKEWLIIEKNEANEWIQSSETLDLTFSPDSEDILQKKQFAKQELVKWAEMVKAEESKEKNEKHLFGSIDFKKPILTYIGRFDSYQKGLDKLDEAIKETLANGGQFIVMGLDQGDSEANKTLSQLIKKYPSGVLVIKDYIDPTTNKPHYQMGTETVPAIGPVVRAATDYVFLPSRYEPCGLVQFEAWLFASLAIGSNTGGLADTINPPGNPNKIFNGFLFEREKSDKLSLKHIITTALTSWQALDDVKKREVMQKVMLDAKNSSWTQSSQGYSPIEKYRFAYENAIRRQHLRSNDKEEKPTQFSLEDYYQKIRDKQRIPNASNVAASPVDEEYLRLYYTKGVDSHTLAKAYNNLPEGWRHAVPSPYGKNVNFERYKEYGSHIIGESTKFKLSAPKAKNVQLKIVTQDKEATYPMAKDLEGNWEFICKAPIGSEYQYIIDGQDALDPYSMKQSTGHTLFTHYAPDAQNVEVQIQFGPRYRMTKQDDGFWTHKERIQADLKYDYIVDGTIIHSSKTTDAPYSVVTDSNSYAWNDSLWMQEREKNAPEESPMSLYEVHLPSWKKSNGKPLNYRELAHELVAHCQKTGYSHVELMGVLEHSYEKSMGYQVTGFYAPNHRMGSLDDFKYMIDTLHNNNIGIILDFVPNHFAVDSYGIAALSHFEKRKPSLDKDPEGHIIEERRQLLLSFGSKFFNMEKKEVREFLISSAAYWLKEMHIDGLRVDAVRSILFSDQGENPSFKNKGMGALFLKDLNAVIHQQFPGVVTMAEDYSYSGTTFTYATGGFSFDYKWHIGWMKKTLDFFEKPLDKRKSNYHLLVDAAKEDPLQKNIMALSHDQTKKTMKSLLEKASGLTEAEKFANLRSMLSFMMCLPGKKLMVMGSEFGTKEEWDKFIEKSTGQNDSEELESEYGKQTMACVKAFNDLYRTTPALFQKNNSAFFDPKSLKQGKQNEDLQWVINNDPNKQVVAYRRLDKKAEQSVICLHNFTGEASKNIEIPLPKDISDKIAAESGDIGKIIELINSDEKQFGGSNLIKNDSIQIKKRENGTFYYTVSVPPLSTVVIGEVGCKRNLFLQSIEDHASLV